MGNDENNKNTWFNINVNLDQVFKTGALTAGAAAMVKYCPPQARLRATLGLAGIWGGVTIINNYINNSNTAPGGPSWGISGTTSTSVGDTNSGNPPGDSSNNVSKSI